MVTCVHVGSQICVAALHTSSTWQTSLHGRCCRTPHVKRGTGSNTPTSGSNAHVGSPRSGTHNPSSASQISLLPHSDSTCVAQAMPEHDPLGTMHWPT